MSNNERARHLDQFVAESEPPPLAQHLPTMPSASQRFAAVQQQQLNSQRQGAKQVDFLNFLDPYAKTGPGKLNFDPFSVLVNQQQQQQQQNDEDSTTDDDDTTETTDDTVSTSAESSSTRRPAPTVVKTKPVTPAAVAPPVVATRPKAPPPPPPPAPKPVESPTIVAPPPAVTAVQQAAPTVPLATAPVQEEPRGIMDQSMAFLSRNFWAILTVIVVLIALGVAFIYFARPRPGETTVPTSTPQVKQTGPPGSPSRWSNVENEVVAPAEEITKLQKEKADAESAYEALQKRIQQAEEEIKNANNEQKNHLQDIQSLQTICDQLHAETDELKQQNTQLADFIVQNQILPPDEQEVNVVPQQQQEDVPQTAETVVIPAPDPEYETPNVTVTQDETASVANQTDFIDIDAIEKSALETIDTTQPEPSVQEASTDVPPSTDVQGEEEAEKLPWQK